MPGSIGPVIPRQILITGAVGIGGTALGTWLTGRQQTKNLQLTISTDNERAQRGDKQPFYVNFLSAITTAVSAARALRDYGTDANDEERRALVDQKDQALVHLVNADSELALLAPPGLTELADDSAGQVEQYANDCEQGTEPDFDYYEVRLKLYEAMRADLGKIRAE
jgi:hypothetical protein